MLGMLGRSVLLMQVLARWGYSTEEDKEGVCRNHTLPPTPRRSLCCSCGSRVWMSEWNRCLLSLVHVIYWKLQ